MSVYEDYSLVAQFNEQVLAAPRDQQAKIFKAYCTKITEGYFALRDDAEALLLATALHNIPASDDDLENVKQTVLSLPSGLESTKYTQVEQHRKSAVLKKLIAIWSLQKVEHYEWELFSRSNLASLLLVAMKYPQWDDFVPIANCCLIAHHEEAVTKDGRTTPIGTHMYESDERGAQSSLKPDDMRTLSAGLTEDHHAHLRCRVTRWLEACMCLSVDNYQIVDTISRCAALQKDQFGMLVRGPVLSRRPDHCADCRPTTLEDVDADMTDNSTASAAPSLTVNDTNMVDRTTRHADATSNEFSPERLAPSPDEAAQELYEMLHSHLYRHRKLLHKYKQLWLQLADVPQAPSFSYLDETLSAESKHIFDSLVLETLTCEQLVPNCSARDLRRCLDALWDSAWCLRPGTIYALFFFKGEPLPLEFLGTLILVAKHRLEWPYTLKLLREARNVRQASERGKSWTIHDVKEGVLDRICTHHARCETCYNFGRWWRVGDGKNRPGDTLPQSDDRTILDQMSTNERVDIAREAQQLYFKEQQYFAGDGTEADHVATALRAQHGIADQRGLRDNVEEPEQRRSQEQILYAQHIGSNPTQCFEWWRDAAWYANITSTTLYWQVKGKIDLLERILKLLPRREWDALDGQDEARAHPSYIDSVGMPIKSVSDASRAFSKHECGPALKYTTS